VIWVLDASVILKWLLEDPDREPDTDKATAVVQAVIDRRAELLQPVHWLAEVAAVLARLTPQTALEDVELLASLQWPVSDEPSVIRRATALAMETGQHVFDTLYHAVALEQEATLITADDRFREKVLSHGRILALRDWAMAI
jgi:predicted nucleic acid-binding protein